MSDASENAPAEKPALDVTPDQAYDILLVLGGETTLNQLHQVLLARFRHPPSPTQLQKWAAKHDWKSKMRKAAERIEAGVEDRVIRNKVSQRAKEVLRLERIIEHSLDMAGASLSGEARENGVAVPAARLDGSVGAVRQLVATATEASKQRLLLLGEATERVGTERELLSGVSDEHLVDRYERALRRKADQEKARKGAMH